MGTMARLTYGTGFDCNTAAHFPKASLELLETTFVVDDLMQLPTVRVPTETRR
jgi:hypothetical protein